MPEDSDSRIYELDIEYRDAGFEVGIPVNDWIEIVREDFTSFDAIRGTFQTDRESLQERLREKVTEVDEEGGGDYEGPRFHIDNPPQSWVDDPASVAPILDQINILLARMGLYVLIENELEAQDELLSNGRYLSATVRQSAFIEDYLIFIAQLALQGQKGGVLSNNDMDLIEDMGHRDRIRLAFLLGAIDEEDHGLLQRMAKWRNEIAHSTWSDFSPQQESQIEATAKQVRDFLQQRIDESEDYFEEIDHSESVEDFLGFQALDIDQQLLQISIFTVVDARDGSATLSEIKDIVPGDPEEVEGRCSQMIAIGYLEKEGDEIRITDEGREFYEETS